MAEVSFQFHIVLNSQGSISGPELIQQIEDGINDIGRLAADSNSQSSSAEQKAQQAVTTANSAQSTANNALANSESAIEQVQTLGQTVNSYDSKITSAVGQANSAVTTANAAAASASAAAESASDAKEAAETAASQAQTAQENSASSATAAGAAQTASETAQTAAQEAQQLAQQAQQQAQEAQQAAEEASINSNILHAYNGVLTADGSVPVADLVPATGKQGDLVVDNLGVIYQINAVNEGNAYLLGTGSILTGFVSYVQAQTFTDEQRQQIWSNIGLQLASTTTAGLIAITTQDKITTGTDDASAVTPLSLNSNAVLFSKAQTLTAEQQAQARTNIGALAQEDATASQILQAFQDFADEHGITIPTDDTGTDSGETKTTGGQ